MLITLDIGNSTLSALLHENEKILRSATLASNPPPDAGQIEAMLGELNISTDINKTIPLIAASVVPGLTATLKEAALNRMASLHLVDYRSAPWMKFDIYTPAELGPDRVATAVAAAALVRGPSVVIDFGTATTLNFITFDNDGPVYIGGTIMPGLAVQARSLLTETAALPEISLLADSKVPGKDTPGNIAGGIVLGTAGAVERIIHDIEQATSERFEALVTGGNAEIVIPHLQMKLRLLPDLCHTGLALIGNALAAD